MNCNFQNELEMNCDSAENELKHVKLTQTSAETEF